MSFSIENLASTAAHSLSVKVATIVNLMFGNRFYAFAFCDLVMDTSEFILLEY